MIDFHHIDCMDFMRGLPDKAYDIAIVDAPYGIGVGKMAFLQEMGTTVKQKNGTRINGNRNKKPYKHKEWDNAPPPQEYYNELQRVSRHQIIFGIDYMDWQGVGTGRIIWDKGVPKGMSFKRYEVAYCSLIEDEVKLPLLWAGMCQAKSLTEPMTQQGNKKLNEKRIHPCHKPILLYKALITRFVKPGWKILDTHGGSGSIAIACDEMGYDLDICELDKEYFDNMVRRYNQYKQQLKMPL